MHSSEQAEHVHNRTGVAALVLLLLASCSSPRPSPVECRTHDDCATEAAPYCDAENGVCVGCTVHDQCGCHEVCVDARCVPLGAATPGAALSAHGRWAGQPGSEGYAFRGYCVSDNDCEFGQICNPLTQGCLDSTDFAVSCGAGQPCPAGPHGETLVCEPSRQKCLPAPLCVGSHNCTCPAPGSDALPNSPLLACEPVANVCRVLATECTAPQVDEIISLRPFAPRRRDACASGEFCSPVGTCVTCLSDDDCPSVQRCHPSRNECVSGAHCSTSAECGEGESCDGIDALCRPRCDGPTDCPAGEYCEPQYDVCRSICEVPCTFDPLDDVAVTGEGNESLAEAVASGSSLVAPTAVGSGGAVTSPAYSVCSTDVDWFTLELTKGDLITVRGTPVECLQGQITVYAPDGATALAEGLIARSGGEDAVFVADFTSTFYVRVAPTGQSSGRYTLQLTKDTGVPCADPLEDAAGLNDTPATATVLNDAAIYPGGVAPPSGCIVEGTLDGDHAIHCIGGMSAMCLGDRDYYVVRAPAGSTATVTVGNSAQDLDVALYGPFDDDAALSDDPEHLAQEATGPVATHELSVFRRSPASYLVFVRRVLGPDGGPFTYDLSLDVSLPPSTCSEDSYDAATAADPLDDPGSNDLAPSGLLLAANANVSAVANLCVGDADLYRLGVDDGGAGLENVPPGWRVQVDVAVQGGSPSGALTLAAGPSLDNLSLGSGDMTAPATSVLIESSDGGPYYLRVVGEAPGAADRVDYTLTVSTEAPPACLPDTYEANDTPAAAAQVTPPWSAVGEVALIPPADTVTACGFDDDWYEVTLPTGTRAIARLTYDPASEVELGLAVYSDAVASVPDASVPGGSAIAQGQLQRSELDGLGYQRVVGDAGPSTFLQVYNRAGWPLNSYSLELELVGSVCAEDAFEVAPGNDSGDVAPALPLVRDAFDPSLETWFADPLTLCNAADPDWYAVDLQPGDELRARAFYRPDLADLTLFLHEPWTGPSTPSTWLDVDSDAGSSGLLEVAGAIAPAGEAGAYLLHVNGASGGDSPYALEVVVQRACADDAFEAAAEGEAVSVSLPFAQTLQLCRDDDWLELEVSGSPTSLTVCMTNAYGALDPNGSVIDLDMTLHADTQSNPVDTSDAKAPLEKISMSNPTDGTYYLHVFQDPTRNPVSTSYELVVQADGDPCP